MATKYQYLIDPLLGFQTKSGSLNTAGIIRVYDAATDDPAVTYKDFAGTENTQDIRLDDNGRAVVICDDARAYRVEVCDRYGSLLYTQSPLYAKGGGGGVMTGVEVTSDDGTVRVETTTDGGIKKFDLSVVDPSDPEYITCNSYYVKGYGSAGCGYIVPQGKVEGNMDVDGEGILLKAGCHYHVDAWLNAVADAENSDPSNAYRTREMLLNFRLGAADATPVSLTFDNSFYHKDSYNLSGDIHPTNDTYLKLYFDNYEWSNYNSSYISSSHIELPRITVHSIVGAYGGGLESVYHDLTLTGTGTPDDLLGVADGSIGTAQLRPEINDILDEAQLPSDWEASSGVQQILHKPDLSVYATKSELSEGLADKQDVLTAGDNISIVNNVISASFPEQVNADWESNSGKSEILHKPDLSVYATKTEVSEDLADKQDVLTAGSNITIENNVISASVPEQVNSDWEATSGIQEILNKPIVRDLIPGNNITMEDSANGVVISATAAPQVNADWNASSGVSAILNKPDLSVYATETELTTGLAGKQDNMVVLTYGTSTWADFTAAYDKNAIVYCRVSTGTNQYRLAFMAYRNETGVEFQYVRSISTHNATNQGDQVFVYKLDSTNTWTTTTREMVLQAKAGNGITRTVTTEAGAGTIEWAVKAGSGVTVDSNGVSVTNPVPSYDASDADKVLGVVTDGVTTALQWVQGGGGGGGGTEYSAGEGITILGEEISVKAGTGLGFDSSTEELVVNVPVPEPTAADEDKVLGVTDANGTIDWVDATPAQVNADWNATSGVAEILNKPNLSIYATYADLMYKQDVLTPGAHISIQNNVISTDVLPQVNSDWDANSGVQEILNKPDIKPLVAGTGILITEGANAVTVEATGGSYTQVNADWDSTSGVSEILHKPDLSIYAESANLATVATTGAYSDLSGTPTLATVATSGSYTDLTDKPTINNVPVVTSSDDNKVLKASYDGGVGSYSWEEAPATQVNSDWEATSGVQEILNKPDLVDIVAGPGIVVDNPDGNTLRVSMAADYEVELYKNSGVPNSNTNDVFTLVEPVTNFERIRVEFWNREFNQYRVSLEYYITDSTTSTVFVANMDHSTSTTNIQRVNMFFSYNSDGNIVDAGHNLFYGNGGSHTNGNTRGLGIHRVVGIHRIQGGN